MDVRRSEQPGNLFHHALQAFKALLLGASVIACIIALSHIRLSSYFPIKTVRVYGVNHVNHNDVQQILTPLVNRSFFTVNVDYIRDRLLQMPWVGDIFVRRHWPDQVEVTIVEKNAVGRWNNESLLSEAGEVFSPVQSSYPAGLPKLVGPTGKHTIVLDYYKQLNRLLEPLHARISYLELTPYLTWKMMLSNGIMLQMGHKDILTRLSHFVKVYPKIVGDRTADVDYVDLRYPNGMAVRWRSVVKT